MNRFIMLYAAVIGVLARPVYLLAWPIPDTCQSKFYDEAGIEISYEGTEQDGEYLINPPSYTKLDAKGNDLPDETTSSAPKQCPVLGRHCNIDTNAIRPNFATSSADPDGVGQMTLPGGLFIL